MWIETKLQMFEERHSSNSVNRFYCVGLREEGKNENKCSYLIIILILLCFYKTTIVNISI